ncbi:MAG: ribosome biogenesis GTPase Der [Spirochaetia bacterium]|nr:ribosome biogenesis GTPase Der [Spirochaetota bacterium]MCX8096816.1 ribosome biogenesis GTPase Der [Spirochaetota bacterium]MDW8112785.1 ribosome biogenesis GTPase Der [Spirochaetia bacterium]
MRLGVVSIVGRPNTGKSSLFNAIVGRGKAIVFDKAGTTIDINKEIVNLDGVEFILQDTGGYTLDSYGTDIPAKLVGRVKELLLEALEASTLILFTVEYKVVDFLDFELAKLLRKYQDKVKLVVTKVDTFNQRIQVSDDVYRLGFKSMFFVSSKTKYGFDDLLEGIKMFILERSKVKEEERESEPIKVSIVGRVNVGKSSIMNAILKSNRSLVDEEPGTTRDSVDDFVEGGGVSFRITDTAGFRRSIFKAGLIEKFGIERTKTSIQNSDVVVVVIDGSEGITSQDKKVLRYVMESYKPFIIVVNKIDLVIGIDKLGDKKEEKVYENAFKDFLSRNFEGTCNIPVIPLSAKYGYNLDKIFETVKVLYESSRKRISTGVLNRKIRELVPHLFSGELSTKLRIYYITQVDVNPPTFAVFVNKVENFKKNFEIFLKNKIAELFGFTGIGIRIIVKERERKRKKGD